LNYGILCTLLKTCCQCNTNSIDDCILTGDGRPYHHVCAVQESHHCLTVSVKVSDECYIH